LVNEERKNMKHIVIPHFTSMGIKRIIRNFILYKFCFNYLAQEITKQSTKSH
jgi:hypothetical protein